MLVPRRVRDGDTVAVVSPSFGAVGLFPHRTERAIAYLESLGLRVRLMPHAAETAGWASSSAANRVADIHEAFSDDQVSAIVCGIGGLHANQLLPLLDYDLIRRSPKIFQGYSDITVLHWAFAKHAGLRTFYGPALITQLAEYPGVHEFTERFMRAAWFGGSPIEFEPAKEWTDERLEWSDKTDLTRARAMQPGSGWVCIRPGATDGWLMGGCVETLCWHVKGSDSWLNLDGAVLYLETSEDAPSPAEVDAYLVDLENLGVFEVCGLLSSDARWGTARHRRSNSGLSLPIGRPGAASLSSAIWIAAIPTQCSPCRSERTSPSTPGFTGSGPLSLQPAGEGTRTTSR